MKDQTYWAYNYCPTSYSWLVLLGLVLYLAAFAPGSRGACRWAPHALCSRHISKYWLSCYQSKWDIFFLSCVSQGWVPCPGPSTQRSTRCGPGAQETPALQESTGRSTSWCRWHSSTWLSISPTTVSLQPPTVYDSLITSLLLPRIKTSDRLTSQSVSTQTGSQWPLLEAQHRSTRLDVEAAWDY